MAFDILIDVDGFNSFPCFLSSSPVLNVMRIVQVVRIFEFECKAAAKPLSLFRHSARPTCNTTPPLHPSFKINIWYLPFPYPPYPSYSSMGIVFSITTLTQKLTSKLHAHKAKKQSQSQSHAEPPPQQQPYSHTQLTTSAEALREAFQNEHLSTSSPPIPSPHPPQTTTRATAAP